MLQRYLLPVFIVLCSSMLLVYSLDQEYAKANELLAKETLLDSDLKDVRTIEAKRRSLELQLSGFPKEGVQRLSIMLPDAVSEVRMIMDVKRIIEKNGLTIQLPSVNKKTDASMDALGIEQYVMSFTVNATYEQFRVLMSELEKSLHLRDATGLGFSFVKKSESDPTPSSRVLYKFEVSISSYALKQDAYGEN